MKGIFNKALVLALIISVVPVRASEFVQPVIADVVVPVVQASAPAVQDAVKASMLKRGYSFVADKVYGLGSAVKSVVTSPRESAKAAANFVVDKAKATWELAKANPKTAAIAAGTALVAGGYATYRYIKNAPVRARKALQVRTEKAAKKAAQAKQDAIDAKLCALLSKLVGKSYKGAFGKDVDVKAIVESLNKVLTPAQHQALDSNIIALDTAKTEEQKTAAYINLHKFLCNKTPQELQSMRNKRKYKKAGMVAAVAAALGYGAFKAYRYFRG